MIDIDNRKHTISARATAFIQIDYMLLFKLIKNRFAQPWWAMFASPGPGVQSPAIYKNYFFACALGNQTHILQTHGIL